jgi:hypothetical protein
VAKTFAEMLDAAGDGEEFGAVVMQIFAAAEAAKDRGDDESSV